MPAASVHPARSSRATPSPAPPDRPARALLRDLGRLLAPPGGRTLREPWSSARSYLSPPAPLLARLRALLRAPGMRAGAAVFAGGCVSAKVRLEVKPMRPLRQSLLAITALLLSACGTGYDYKPSQVDCNDRVNYFLCHFNAI